MKEIAFLTRQYVKLLRALFYLENNEETTLPVLHLLTRNVEARKSFIKDSYSISMDEKSARTIFMGAL
jgi:hypothetical protein